MDDEKATPFDEQYALPAPWIEHSETASKDDICDVIEMVRFAALGLKHEVEAEFTAADAIRVVEIALDAVRRSNEGRS